MSPSASDHSDNAEIARLRKVVTRLKQLTVKYQQAEIIQKALFRISELAASVQDMNEFYARVHGIIGELMFSKNFFICLYDDTDDTVQFVYFVDEYDDIPSVENFPMEVLRRGMTGYVLRTGKPFWYDEKEFKKLIETNEITDLGAAPVDWIGVPLISGERVIGAMVVQSYNEDQRYTQADQDLLVFVSQHIVNALERLQQREYMQAEIQRQTAKLREINDDLVIEIEERQRAEKVANTLFTIAEITNTSDSMSSFYHALHDQIGLLIHNQNFFVALLDDAKQNLFFPYYVDALDSNLQKSRPLGRGMTEYVIRTKKSVFIDEKLFAQLSAEHEIDDSVKNYGTPAKQWLGSPLLVDDEVIGVLSVQSYSDDVVYKQEDLDLLNFVSQHVAVAIERRRNADEIKRMNVYLERKVSERTEELVSEIERRKKIEEKLSYDANHDTLTGLPNRNMLIDRLQHTLKHKKRFPHHHFAVLFVDLDRFKDINDSLGHSAGDEFLLEASRRIGQCIRENDTVARLGGDEFVILLDMIQSVADASDVASRIIERMKQPFEYGESLHYSGASIGIAECQDDDDSAERLLRDADAAMYQAKSMGRGTFVIFDESIHSDLVASLHRETELRHAQFDQDFVVRQELLHEPSTQTIYGAEMKLRWQRDTSMMSAERLFAVAEKTGMLMPLDHWLLERCCNLLTESPEFPRLFIPLSSKHLYKLTDVTVLEKIINKSGVEPSRLVFEFSEADLNYSSKRQLTSLRHLADFGVRLAVNHFGRSNGALHFIMNHPFHLIKLDPEYVASMATNERSQVMMRNVVRLCNELNIVVIAAGVANEEQHAAVAAEGVMIEQGSYYGEARQLQAQDSL